MGKLLFVLGIALAGLTACGSNPGRGETVGTVGGAAVGGALGSAVTGGSTIGTLGGAVAGGVVGNQAGERYDKNHPR